jgi:DNA adenine methylase
MKTITITCNIFKVDDEERLVGGIVYEPEVVDAQGDSASAEEIAKACHDFLENAVLGHSGMGIMHKEAAGDRIRIVECAIAHDNFVMGGQQIKKGTWFMVVKVYDDEIWKGVKDGRYTGFSMAGTAQAA